MSGVLKRTWATGPDELLHHDPKRPLFDRNTTWCNQLIKGCACWFMRRKQPKPTLKGQQHSLPGRSSSNEKGMQGKRGWDFHLFGPPSYFHPQTGAEVLAKQSWKWFFFCWIQICRCVSGPPILSMPRQPAAREITLIRRASKQLILIHL